MDDLQPAAGPQLSRRTALVAAATLLAVTTTVKAGSSRADGGASVSPPMAPTIPEASRPSGAPPIRVGPARELTVPSQAAKIAQDGDVIQLDAGDYRGDVAVWVQNDLTIRSVGGRAHLIAAGAAAEAKAIWVIKGTRVTVDGVELSGCMVPDRNGAGIRFEGTELIIRNSWIHDNQMGLLTKGDPAGAVLIETSEFSDNTVDYQTTGSLGHNIYVGAIGNFTLRGSYVHGASFGHNVKTRARHNYILYNRIMDEDSGNSSYLIDLAHGGDAYIIGNLLQQSGTTDNAAMIAYATEGGQADADPGFYVVNNSAVSDLDSGVLVHNHGVTSAILMNNVFMGGRAFAEGPSVLQRNLVGDGAGLEDPAGYDYRLASGARAIDAGIEPIAADGVSLAPRFEYRHPARYRPRPRSGPLDVGAYEAVPD